MKTYAAFMTLIAELEGDLVELGRAEDLNTRAWERIQAGGQDPLDWAALGYTLHSIYGIMENYFLRISKFFENSLPPHRWHKELVDKMALTIPEIRPAFFEAADEHRRVGEMMKFRHRFRNLYGEDLDPRKTAEIQEIGRQVLRDFPRRHEAFVAKLRLIAEAIR